MGNYIQCSLSVIEQENGTVSGFKKHIERVGRLCYKSLDKITDTSYEGFVQRMKMSKHGAMLEHGTVYLAIPVEGNDDMDAILFYEANRFSKTQIVDRVCYVTTNYRVLAEGNREGDLDKYFVAPTPYHERRVTMDFVTDRAVSHETVRHRVFSFAQESQRYVNYLKEKFGACITFTLPHWVNELGGFTEEMQQQAEAKADEMLRKKSFWERLKNLFKKQKDDLSETELYLLSTSIAEKAYLKLVDKGLKPQDARAVLPNTTKTEIIMTGFVSDWIHFVNLRSLGTTGAPHPDIKVLADQVKDELIARGYITLDALNRE